MPYVPSIRNYKPFYIQTDSDASAWDTRDYGMIVQEQPFPDNYEVKDQYKNDWHDAIHLVFQKGRLLTFYSIWFL